MKINFIYSSVAIALLGCNSAEKTENTGYERTDTLKKETVQAEEPLPENSFLLDAGTVGVFKVGVPFPKLPAELKSRKAYVKRTNPDGLEEEHLQHIIFNSLEDVAEVILEKNDGKTEDQLAIQEIRVISDNFETSEAISVGSSISDITSKYEQAQFTYKAASGDYVMETASMPGVEFVIDPEGCTKKINSSSNVKLSANQFKPDAKIQLIIVH
jgi:hypothetical protein